MQDIQVKVLLEPMWIKVSEMQLVYLPGAETERHLEYS